MAEENNNTPDAPQNLLGGISRWPRGRKISLIIVAAASILAFALIIWQYRSADYRVLYANLSNNDAAAVVEWLKERKISYQLEDAGRSVLIPDEQVYEVRLELAGAGLPSGGVGFEIFDKQSFGMTDFAQKVNYLRALQGELARTIAALAPVEATRIHIALPEKRLFKNQQKETKASVSLKLVPGQKLTDNQIRGIVNMIAGSVEGLEAENVNLVDEQGRILTKDPGKTSPNDMSPEMLSYQQAVEKRLEERAQSLLDLALGRDYSLVRVTAELDFSRIEKTEEIYDPAGAVPRSEQTVEEKSGSENAAGVPGVDSNLKESGRLSGYSPSSKSSEIINYEVSRTINHVKAPFGEVKKLSVSVLVADKMVEGPAGQESEVVPRTEKELQNIEGMVKTAIGFDVERGDQVQVVSMPLPGDFSPAAWPEPSFLDKVYPLMPLVKYVFIGALALLLYFLLLRPLIKTLKTESRMIEHYKTVEQLQSEMGSEAAQLTAGKADPVAKIRKDALESRELPGMVIKNWLRQD
jgi:flagellar M-ring protein FliF